jgi:protein-L-isoaspartate(D-aspartate) O-methyltransferase
VIGTGFGWQTALLAHLAGEVWSVERWQNSARTARSHLARHGIENATLVGDGSGGLPGHAPYDAILVAAAFPQVPLAEQLADGGRLVQPIGLGAAAIRSTRARRSRRSAPQCATSRPASV